MSNTQNEQIMGQVMSVVDRLAGNPNSKMDVNNVFDTINKLRDTITDGYKRVANLEASTSLTAAVAPAETAAEVTTAPVTTQATPAATPVATVTEPVQSAPAVEPVKAAAKRTATATVKSAPAAKPTPAKASKSETTAPAVAPLAETPVVAPEMEANAPAAKAGRRSTAKVAKADKPAKATKETRASKKAAKQVAAVTTQEDKDVATAESMIQEHGSARGAAAYVEKNRTRGRKTAWQKIIEERADQELRNAAKSHKKINADGLAAAIASVKGTEISPAQAARDYSLSTTGYAFSHISRDPVMDPEKALGAMITCLIDGSKRTMLSRRLEAKWAMTPEEYIAHFDLRHDYPTTATAYKEEKRRLAEVQELGKRKPDEAAPVEQETPATPAATNRRSRSRAA
jgi:predicted transcriptional regulator